MAGVAAKVSVWCGGIIWQWRSCSCVDRGECRFGRGLLLVLLVSLLVGCWSILSGKVVS